MGKRLVLDASYLLLATGLMLSGLSLTGQAQILDVTLSASLAFSSSGYSADGTAIQAIASTVLAENHLALTLAFTPSDFSSRLSAPSAPQAMPPGPPAPGPPPAAPPTSGMSPPGPSAPGTPPPAPPPGASPPTAPSPSAPSFTGNNLGLTLTFTPRGFAQGTLAASRVINGADISSNTTFGSGGFSTETISVSRTFDPFHLSVSAIFTADRGFTNALLSASAKISQGTSLSASVASGPEGFFKGTFTAKAVSGGFSISGTAVLTLQG